LASFAYAGDSPRAVTIETPEEAQVAVALAAKALEQATAWQSVSKEELDKATQALAKKPKSAKAKAAVAAAQKELDTATAYRTKKELALKEEQIEKTAIDKMALQNQAKTKVETPSEPEAVAKAIFYPTEKFSTFSEDFEGAETVDAFSFFNDPLDYHDKMVILDAKLDNVISPGVAKFTMWRNFGKMHLIVSNLPADEVIPHDKTLLLAGVITGFSKEVISGELILNVLVKLKGAVICSDTHCRLGRL
jgi:hypothetical protein